MPKHKKGKGGPYGKGTGGTDKGSGFNNKGPGGKGKKADGKGAGSNNGFTLMDKCTEDCEFSKMLNSKEESAALLKKLEGTQAWLLEFEAMLGSKERLQRLDTAKVHQSSVPFYFSQGVSLLRNLQNSLPTYRAMVDLKVSQLKIEVRTTKRQFFDDQQERVALDDQTKVQQLFREGRLMYTLYINLVRQLAIYNQVLRFRVEEAISQSASSGSGESVNLSETFSIIKYDPDNDNFFVRFEGDRAVVVKFKLNVQTTLVDLNVDMVKYESEFGPDYTGAHLISEDSTSDPFHASLLVHGSIPPVPSASSGMSGGRRPRRTSASASASSSASPCTPAATAPTRARAAPAPSRSSRAELAQTEPKQNKQTKTKKTKQTEKTELLHPEPEPKQLKRPGTATKARASSSGRDGGVGAPAPAPAPRALGRAKAP